MARYHILGTDPLGRDLLSRMMFGGRVSLLVGITVVTVASPLGVPLGLISGFFGKWPDAIIMRVADIQLAVPFILLAIAIMAILGTGLVNVILVLGHKQLGRLCAHCARVGTQPARPTLCRIGRARKA